MQEFFVGVPLSKSVLSSLMVLLPKKESPGTFVDYRPMCLCNFLNKVITRVLCNRMKSIMSSLISPEQSTIVKGRDIMDNVLLAQEMVPHVHKKIRGNNFIFQLDI